MSFQDWTPVTLKKVEKKPKAVIRKEEVIQAIRKGQPIETSKKFLGGTNKSTKKLVPNAGKLDEDTGDYHIDRVSHDFATALQKARLKKKMTQAELAKAVNEKPSVINAYENKNAIPNGQLINALNRVLETRLPPAKNKRSSAKEDAP